MKHEIVIIGTDPPCPRCDYLTRMVQDIVEMMQLDVPVRHIAYTSNEARRIASESGLLPGTAKDVAQKVDADVNWENIHALTDGADPEHDQDFCCGSAAQKWSPALDEALRHYEEKSGEAGIMMTPVLVIKGKRVHNGSVPDRVQVAEWIREAFDVAPDSDRDEDIIEILGVGCQKCDTLYARVSAVLTEMGIAGKVKLKKRSDVGYFAEKGVTMTPGLVINGQVVFMGRLPDSDQIAQKLGQYLGLPEKSG